MPYSPERLRFVQADHLKCGANSLNCMELRASDDRTIGQLYGVVIDPAARQVRYFVVEDVRWLTRQRYLVAQCAAQVGTSTHTLWLDCDEPELQEFNPDQIPEFSDDDLIHAMFAGDDA